MSAVARGAYASAWQEEQALKSTYHIPLAESDVPKRGDLMQSNVGKKTERTWIILAVRKLKPKFCAEMGCETHRYKVWAERWWELDPAMRMALWQSAERAGGQSVHGFYRFPAKKPPTFEQYMRRGVD